MFKAEYIAYQWIYIHICFICQNNTANHSTFWSAIIRIERWGL